MVAFCKKRFPPWLWCELGQRTKTLEPKCEDKCHPQYQYYSSLASYSKVLELDLVVHTCSSALDWEVGGHHKFKACLVYTVSLSQPKLQGEIKEANKHTHNNNPKPCPHLLFVFILPSWVFYITELCKLLICFRTKSFIYDLQILCLVGSQWHLWNTLFISANSNLSMLTRHLCFK